MRHLIRMVPAEFGDYYEPMIGGGALFFLAGMLYERTHTREIAAYGGIARVVPMLAVILSVVSLSSIGLPGTNGFIGEFLVLIGSWGVYPWATAIATTVRVRLDIRKVARERHVDLDAAAMNLDLHDLQCSVDQLGDFA